MFGSADSRVPAVVIGGELNGLGVCRSLAAGGMPIWVVARKRSNPALWSSYAHPVLTDVLRGLALSATCAIFRGGSASGLSRSSPKSMLTISEHQANYLRFGGVGTSRCKERTLP
jgi:D-aspartate ligase